MSNRLDHADQKIQVWLDDFIAFARGKPAAERYNYGNCHGKCPVGQYMAARGIDWNFGAANMGPCSAYRRMVYRLSGARLRALSVGVEEILQTFDRASDFVGALTDNWGYTWTWGALADRLEAFKAKHPEAA